MRAALRALVALLVLLLVAIGGLAWWLPRWLASDAARDRLLTAAREATGREVDARTLDWGLLPPRLVAKEVRVGDAAAPLVAAERVALRLDVAALLSRTLRVESLALDGVTWRIVRTPDGVDWPWRAGDPGRAAAAAPEVAVAAAAASPLDLAVERIAIERSRLVFEDATRTPPARIALDGVAGEARGAAVGAPLAVSLVGTLATGGTVRLARDPANASAPDLAVTLEGVDLAVLAPYLGEDLALAGRVSGAIDLRGAADALEALDAALEIADADVRAGDVLAKGPVAVTAKLSGALEALAGSFELDATRAVLEAYGGAFRKQPGAPAKATGTLVRDAQGRLGVDSVRVKIENMDGAANIGVDGVFFSDADRFRSEGLVATIGGQPVAIELDVTERRAGGRHRTRVTTAGADAQALFAGLGRPALLEGALDFDAQLTGMVGRGLIDSLAGGIGLAVGPGRIPNVSPLAEAIDLLDEVPEVGRALNRRKTERRLERFLGDRFESIDGRFEVAGGRARTDALVLRYPGYRVELRGSLQLADRSLDAKGRLVLGPEIEAALAGDGERKGGTERVIELARVEGTVDRPKLRIEEAGAVAFAASLTLAQKRGKWERKLDEALGKGKGGDLLDALDGFLGKKER